jgi:hypothetical protein
MLYSTTEIIAYLRDRAQFFERTAAAAPLVKLSLSGFAYLISFGIIRRDEQSDVVLLKLPQKSWRSVKSIDRAQVGAPIVALGFPLNQDVVAVPGLITGVDNNDQWLTNAGLNPE